MNTSERFTYNNKYYFIDAFNDQYGFVVQVINSYGMSQNWHAWTRTNKIFSKYLADLGPWVSLEIDDAIITYVQNGGFAGLTPVEYLRSLGLVECSTSTQP